MTWRWRCTIAMNPTTLIHRDKGVYTACNPYVNIGYGDRHGIASQGPISSKLQDGNEVKKPALTQQWFQTLTLK